MVGFVSLTGITIQSWDELPADEQSQWLEVMFHLNLPPLTDSSLATGSKPDDPVVISNRLSGDPLLAGKVLAVANSAAMGRTREVQSLEQAVVYLGSNLIEIIVAAYQLESMLHTWGDYPRGFFMYVRNWAAAASTLAYNITLNIKRPMASELGTAALLARLGALLFGAATPLPDSRYLEIANDAGRLKLETLTWGLTSPVLSGQLARGWGLPESLSVMLERSWEPLFHEMPDDEESCHLTIVASAVTLAVAVVGNQKFDARAVLDRANSATLKANLRTFGIMDKVISACGTTRMQRELTALLNK